MRREYTDSFEGLSRLRDGLDRLLADVVGPAARVPEMVQGRWAPRLDICERPADITLTVELPGMSKDDVEIELTGDSLSISGERKREPLAAGEQVHRAERPHGPFSRAFSIGVPVDTERTAARLRDGVLTLEIPKAPEAHRRDIAIDVSEDEGGSSDA
ncbi:MAG: Hsp20/alpha crystallin family protein [Armatimonadota bacterium]|jgi:HSP20 family protein